MSALDEFGQFVVLHLFDNALVQMELLLRGQIREPDAQLLQERVRRLDRDAVETLRKIVADTLVVALHDLLFAIQESHDNQTGLEIMVNGVNVAEATDGLQGELLGSDGWIQRFSRANRA